MKAYFLILINNFALFIFCWNTAYAKNITAPSLGNSSFARELSARHERTIGLKFFEAFQTNQKLVEDFLVHNYLEEKLTLLNQYFKLDYQGLLSIILQKEQINAFAAPGGVIGINGGLITKLENESELMSILAHEMAHVKLKHFNRRQAIYNEQNLLNVLLVLGGVLIGGNAGFGLIGGVVNKSTEDALQYSRDYENEADSYAHSAMKFLNYNIHSQQTAFEKMLSENYIYESKNPNIYHRTHPLTIDRVTNAKLKIQNSEKSQGKLQNAITTTLNFILIQKRVEFLSDIKACGKIEPVALTTQTQIKKDEFTGLLYYQALCYHKKGNFVKLNEIVDYLIESNENNSILIYLKLDSLLAQNQNSQALEYIEKQIKLYPYSKVLNFIYSKILVTQNKYNTALEVFLKSTDKINLKISFIQHYYFYLLSANKKNYQILKEKAEYFVDIEQKKVAIKLFNQALVIAIKLKKQNQIQIIKQRIKQVS